MVIGIGIAGKHLKKVVIFAKTNVIIRHITQVDTLKESTF